MMDNAKLDSSKERIEEKRETLRKLVGIVELPENYDAREAYREHLLEKYALGVRIDPS